MNFKLKLCESGFIKIIKILFMNVRMMDEREDFRFIRFKRTFQKYITTHRSNRHILAGPHHPSWTISKLRFLSTAHYYCGSQAPISSTTCSDCEWIPLGKLTRTTTSPVFR